MKNVYLRLEVENYLWLHSTQGHNPFKFRTCWEAAEKIFGDTVVGGEEDEALVLQVKDALEELYSEGRARRILKFLYASPTMSTIEFKPELTGV